MESKRQRLPHEDAIDFLLDQVGQHGDNLASLRARELQRQIKDYAEHPIMGDSQNFAVEQQAGQGRAGSLTEASKKPEAGEIKPQTGEPTPMQAGLQSGKSEPAPPPPHHAPPPPPPPQAPAGQQAKPGEQPNPSQPTPANPPKVR